MSQIGMFFESLRYKRERKTRIIPQSLSLSGGGSKSRLVTYSSSHVGHQLQTKSKLRLMFHVRQCQWCVQRAEFALSSDIRCYRLNGPRSGNTVEQAVCNTSGVIIAISQCPTWNNLLTKRYLRG